MQAGWKATVFYRRAKGSEIQKHTIGELEDLQQLIESGPHFDTVQAILVHRNGCIEHEGLTVERAATL
jgi:hypothetical protein